MYESRISFTLDTMCPWTYIAKKRLDAALALIAAEQAQTQSQSQTQTPKAVHFTLHYLPFQLYPSPQLPSPSEPGLPRHAWTRDTRYGGSEDMARAYEAAMAELAAASGIARMDLARGVVGDTFEALRVVRYFQFGDGEGDSDEDEEEEEAGGGKGGRGKEEGAKRASALLDALYTLYFEEGAHPSAPETLLEACRRANAAHLTAATCTGGKTAPASASALPLINEAEARRAILSDPSLARTSTQRALRRARADGIDSVPHVVIEGRRRDVTLVGAREVAEYVRALRTIVRESV